MSAYVPEYAYGQIGWDRYGQAVYGLAPWPAHMRPRESSYVELTKKGEAYIATVANFAAVTEAAGVFFLTLDPKDRVSIATTIERLIDMLDDIEPDPDLEPWLGWPNDGQRVTEEMASDGDREVDNADWEPDSDDEATGDDEPMLGWTESAGRGIWCAQSDDDREYDAGDDREANDPDQEADPAECDHPGFIWGGNEPGGAAHSGA